MSAEEISFVSIHVRALAQLGVPRRRGSSNSCSSRST
jgi:hypothetical protein